MQGDRGILRGVDRRVGTVSPAGLGARRVPPMALSPAEEGVVTRAVAAYRESKKARKGPFRGVTADQVLDELVLTPGRWAALAAFVVELGEGKDRPG